MTWPLVCLSSAVNKDVWHNTFSFPFKIDGKELDLSNAAEGLRAAIKTVNSTVGAMVR